MPRHLPIKEIEAAEAAVAYAQQVRKFHARRTERTSKQRIDDLNMGLARLSQAMAPLRSMIGRFPYGPQSDIAEQNRQKIREASAAIKKERIKLWKMLPPDQRKEKST